ncbi:hypothetical protein ACTNB0_12365 [Lachnospiraceae bacterium HCP28S3_F9]|uniref:hypothetical protein n=1 Tax=Dorea sp. YH-dor228 TaxID=3151120 RepID=UPI002A769893|nr:hypothetical protein [Blautia obeum]MDY2753466.1 hypothetical protein [Blautia obeum]
MDRLQEINEYINDMKIKKAFFGGYDKEDVYKKIGVIVDLFRKFTEEQQEKQKELIEGYEKRLQASDMLNMELNKKLGSLAAEQKNVIEEKEKMKEVYKEYCANILQQYSNSLRALSAEFTQILDNVTNLQKDIVDEDLFEKLGAEIEAEQIPELSEDEI